MTFINHFTPKEETEEASVAFAENNLNAELETKSSKLHLLISLGSIILLPLFSVLDYVHLDRHLFFQSLIFRGIAMLLVVLGTVLHLLHKVKSVGLVYFTVVLPIVLFNYFCSQIPTSYLQQINLYYVFILTFCSLLILWPTKHTLIASGIGLSSYLFCFFVFGHHYFSLDFVRAGNVFVVLAYLAFPVVNFYHYKSHIKKTINELKLVAMNEQINRQRLEIMQQNAKLREMNQMKDQFFSIISHDLRSPYQNILGFMELAVKNIENGEKADRFIKMAYQSTTTSYQLLEDLMEWTHLQSEKTNYQPENISLKNLAAECFKDLANIAEYKKIELTSSITAQETAFVNINLLKTVIRNLLTNAIKFTNEGGTVNISTCTRGNLREIHVTDNGVGMCQEKMELLFKPHKGFTSIGTKAEKGTGLGLTLCKDILEKAGGSIWVESEIGKGSSFKFTVPMLPSISVQ